VGTCWGKNTIGPRGRSVDDKIHTPNQGKSFKLIDTINHINYNVMFLLYFIIIILYFIIFCTIHSTITYDATFTGILTQQINTFYFVN
jgi:hypothetical protein